MSGKTSKDYVYVGVQLLLFIAYLLLPAHRLAFLPGLLRYPALVILALGLWIVGLALWQLGRSLTIYPSPKEDANLKTGGLYAWMRHPIYTGVILSAVGWALFGQSGSQVLVALALWGLFYFKSRYEEERLLRQYGEAYAQYQHKVGRLFPKRSPNSR